MHVIISEINLINNTFFTTNDRTKYFQNNININSITHPIQIHKAIVFASPAKIQYTIIFIHRLN